ncbi:MAG: hypothetical protein KME25_16850 [Symplocastrum torsivum CPER-KK1]|uniref:Uncharacterized protein n=1 Tax=Symplocastrum torsivum CPER-KK1 TaxID=450513 RepID=A0A951PLE7_9CYAN|nr:hypothetical protein [Symplocastrum torsivum CPER-KK1]
MKLLAPLPLTLPALERQGFSEVSYEQKPASAGFVFNHKGTACVPSFNKQISEAVGKDERL